MNEEMFFQDANAIMAQVEADIREYGYVRVNVRDGDTGEVKAGTITGIGSDIQDEKPVLDVETYQID